MAPTPPPLSSTRAPARRGGRLFNSRPILLLAFAFAVMADPVSSVAYAIEAALRALHGDLSLLLPTMGLVVAVIALIITNYHQLVARFPEGGGAAAAAGKAFGEGWAFVPIGALIVDFVLTIAISVAAGASALIEYVPSLAPDRIPLALLLLVAVAGLTWYGHIGRAAFALMTLAFVGAGIAVIAGGIHAPVANVGYSQATSGRPPVLAVLLAFPVAMALATRGRSTRPDPQRFCLQAVADRCRRQAPRPWGFPAQHETPPHSAWLVADPDGSSNEYLPVEDKFHPQFAAGRVRDRSRFQQEIAALCLSAAECYMWALAFPDSRTRFARAVRAGATAAPLVERRLEEITASG